MTLLVRIPIAIVSLILLVGHISRAMGLNSEPAIEMSTQDLPSIDAYKPVWDYDGSYNPHNVLFRAGPFFIVLPIMVLLLCTITSVVAEKESGRKDFLLTVGLRSYSYWLGTFVYYGLVNSLAIVTVMFFLGNVLRFPVFVNADPAIVFITFLLFTISNISLSLLFSTVCFRLKYGLSGGFLFTIISFTYLGLSSTGGAYVWYLRSDLSPGLWFFGWWMPFFQFGKILWDMSSTIGDAKQLLNGTLIAGNCTLQTSALLISIRL